MRIKRVYETLEFKPSHGIKSAKPFRYPAQCGCRTSVRIAFLCCGVFAANGTAADTLYVALEKDDAVAVIDGATGKIDNSIRVGKRPRGIWLSKDSKKLFVAAGGDNNIAVFDTATLRPLASFPSVKDPKAFALNPAETRAFVVNDGDNELIVIDLVQHRIAKRISIGKEAEGVSISPDGKWIISTSESDSAMYWVDADKLEVVDITAVDSRPRASRFTDDGRQLWVSSQGGASVTIFDVATSRLIKRLQFRIPQVSASNIGPMDIRIDKNRRYAYVALAQTDRVAVVDAQKLEVIQYISVGKRVRHLEFSPDQTRLYAANESSNDISVIDIPSWEVTKTIAVGSGPWGIAVKP